MILCIHESHTEARLANYNVVSCLISEKLNINRMMYTPIVKVEKFLGNRIWPFNGSYLSANLDIHNVRVLRTACRKLFL